ncbi:apolipoprotein D and lipocalin family protein [Modicisalibacter ilicicola DSM 19980]|uniref:Outer membrane lipoprotein Blc n=1 Tax=Modicisalibacter ilicicola DSM 19980 TaxID=1121942 RepID=A0A1M4TDM2_9GAMM|nr:lipocalin family protein [Halomonas ilicicola]SHE42602.1 apolipoprotein D and lipocalin family protein [Halomonas ilicicola DSM 19980]
MNDARSDAPGTATARRCTAPRGAAILVAASLGAGCTGIPEGTQAVRDFELEPYLGRWYEIARLDHSFERGLDCVTAEYSRREDGGVKVINRGVNLEEGEPDVAEGKAYFVEDEDVGRFKVSFFGPFYGGYNILELDADYRHALIAGPNRDYLWILSRTPTLEDDVYQRLVARADELGFETDALIEVEQGHSCAPYRR